jgi:antitoxin CptB
MAAMTDLDIMRRKLKFRASHRGFKEMDLYMESFADAHLAGYDAQALGEFEAILDTNDQTVYAWITGQEQAPVEQRSRVLDQLLAFRYPAPAKQPG